MEEDNKKDIKFSAEETDSGFDMEQTEEAGEQEEDSVIITMKDEDGRDVDFEVLDAVEYKGERYLVLLPPGEEGVVILREDVNRGDEENSAYVTVTDDATLQAVFRVFEEHCKDEFDFE